MTIEERVEFLHQSIESHNAQLGEITDKLATMATDWNARFDKLLKLVETGAETMGKLTAAMSTLDQTATNHKKRIRIEGS